MRIDRNVYDANLRVLEVELAMAEFPEEVTWNLRQEMPWGWREHFTVPFDTNAYGHQLKGTLYFEQMPVNDLYRFSAFELEIPAAVSLASGKCRFWRKERIAVSLREAVNLMQRRAVYHDYRFDPERQGYWLELSEEDNGYEVYRSPLDFSVESALETALFRKRLGAAACQDIAQALEKGDRVKVEVNGKTVFVEVDLPNERLLLTNAAGRPAKLNWWEVFMTRK